MRRIGALMLALAALAPLAHTPRAIAAILLLAGVVVSLTPLVRAGLKRRARPAIDPFGNPAQPQMVSRPARDRVGELS
jgi:hypothetical protein